MEHQDKNSSLAKQNLKISVGVKKLSNSEVEITGEVPSADFMNSWNNAVKSISEETEIPGFRKGNAPEKILIEKVGEAEILEKAAGLSLQENYQKILEENKIEALGRPEIVITKLARGNPLGFRIKTAVLPEVSLPDYRMLTGRIIEKKEDVLVKDEEIDKALEYLRESRARRDGVKPEDGPGALPELDDEFARKLNFDNLASLRRNIQENIKLEKESKYKEKKRMEALDAISKEAKIEIPAILIEAEKNKMISELKENLSGLGLGWDHYLGHIKKTEEELKKDWQEEAEKRVRYGLVLHEISKKEEIDILPEELEREIEHLISRHPSSEREKLDRGKLRSYAYGIIRNEKVFKIFEEGESGS